MEVFKTPLKVNNRSTENSIRIPPSPLLQKLGYGTGVTIYRMNRSPIKGPCSPWAIKRPNTKIKKNEDVIKRLKSEAGILKNISHPNIVGFRAFVKSIDGRDCLAMEDCEISLGDLIEQRSENDLGPFEEAKIIKMSTDILNGLKYLHNVVKLLHGDLKSFNILIKNDFQICKICDFGVALPLDDKGNLDVSRTAPDVEYEGTECWCAPEVLKCPQVITCKADVFSFGLVIWEMWALMPPHVESSCDTSIDLSDTSLVEMSFESNKTNFGKRPHLPAIPVDDYSNSIAIFYHCTEEDYKVRPTAEVLHNCLMNLENQN